MYDYLYYKPLIQTFLSAVKDKHKNLASVVLFGSIARGKGRKESDIVGSKKILLEDGTWYWDLKPDLKMGEEFAL